MLYLIQNVSLQIFFGNVRIFGIIGNVQIVEEEIFEFEFERRIYFVLRQSPSNEQQKHEKGLSKNMFHASLERFL